MRTRRRKVERARRGRALGAFVSLASFASLAALAAAMLAAGGCRDRQGGSSSAWAPTEGHEVVRALPHDPEAFTQGLFYHDGHLYEGTGRYGFSSLREIDLDTGRILRQVDLEERYFGEGIARVGDRVWQLTWRSGRVFVYDLKTFERVATFRYRGEGWGLTYDGSYLVRSDGTAILRFHDPETFEEVGSIVVRDGGLTVADRLNELEWIDGELWANSWQQDQIVRIDRDNGRVLGRIDFTGLYERTFRPDSDEVLNGIAHDPESGRLWVTGKNWSRLFEVRRRGDAP